MADHDDSPDQDQRAAAKARTVALFDRSSETYDRVGVDFFSDFGRRLVEVAGIRDGQHVLDIGCGRGAVLFPAAERVGPDGRVLGIDLAPGMVERTAAEVRARGLANTEVRLGDAEAPAVDPASFDVITLGLVIFFLPHHESALDAYRTALVPGGTLAMSTFGPEDERFGAVFGAVAAHIPTPDGSTAPATTPARAQDGPFGHTERITALLEEHGYTSIDHVEQTYDIEFVDGDKWIEWSWSHGARALWETVPDDVRPVAHVAALDTLAELTPPDGPLVHRWTLRYTTAVAPA